MKIASIILCAGAGSRLHSTKSKMLHEICGRPLAYWPIKHAMAASNLKPVVVIGYQAEEVVASLERYFPGYLNFAHQEQADGTGGAVKAALPFLDPSCEHVIVLCGDAPLITSTSIKQLLVAKQQHRWPIAMLSARVANPFGYGRLVRNHEQHIVRIVEERNATAEEQRITEVNPSVYIFDTKILHKYLPQVQKNQLAQEYYLTDIIAAYGDAGFVDGQIGSMEISPEDMHGINDRKQLAMVQKIQQRRLLDYWMDRGVTFIDPDTTYIDEGVLLAPDVTIYPSAHLRGYCVVKRGVLIENGAVIKDSIIEAHARILPYTCVDDAHVGEHSTVGPFARLRPGTHLAERVHVGNFVEVKNSQLHQEVKAGHLAYIGDAEIGRQTNIGAGTITCNYDGKKKHKTMIGAKSFIGSNATLIAPLEIGESAYVAGGSTIDSDVPAEALALGRARQVNKEKRIVLP